MVWGGQASAWLGSAQSGVNGTDFPLQGLCVLRPHNPRSAYYTQPERFLQYIVL